MDTIANVFYVFILGVFLVAIGLALTELAIVLLVAC